jgi:hypothetical protein
MIRSTDKTSFLGDADEHIGQGQQKERPHDYQQVFEKAKGQVDPRTVLPELGKITAK